MSSLKGLPELPILQLSIREQIVPFTDGSSEQNSPKLTIVEQIRNKTAQLSNTLVYSKKGKKSPQKTIWEQIALFTDRNTEQSSPNLSIWEQCVP